MKGREKRRPRGVESSKLLDFLCVPWPLRGGNIVPHFFECLREKSARLDAGQRYFYAPRLAGRARKLVQRNHRNTGPIRGRRLQEARRCNPASMHSKGGCKKNFPRWNCGIRIPAPWCVNADPYSGPFWSNSKRRCRASFWPCGISPLRPTEIALPRTFLVYVDLGYWQLDFGAWCCRKGRGEGEGGKLICWDELCFIWRVQKPISVSSTFSENQLRTQLTSYC